MSSSKESLTPNDVKAMLHLVADRIIVAEPELSEADRNLGDGDHGIGMKRGMEAAKEALDSVPDGLGVADAFTLFGKAMMQSMGGASGVVFGTLFSGMGKALKEMDGDLTSVQLQPAIVNAANSIMKRGGAKAGDKTMLDSLIPASEAAKSVGDLPIGKALAKVAEAATDGREASKAMIATMGRAKTLGEKSIGFPDAGACSVAIIFQTMSEFANS